MAITTITTSQAPDAKPVAKSFTLSTNWQTMIEVPNYEVPELVFGGSTTIEPGVGEVISPLILCNITANTVSVDVSLARQFFDQLILADLVGHAVQNRRVDKGRMTGIGTNFIAALSTMQGDGFRQEPPPGFR